MSLQRHAKLLGYSFATWLTFYLIGLPEYYQQWYFWAKVIAVVGLTLAYFPMARFSLKLFWDDQRHFRNSFVLALYLTVPLFTYDYLLLGWYKGLGISFVWPYWYLSFFYFSFWLQIPYVGWRLERERGS